MEAYDGTGMVGCGTSRECMVGSAVDREGGAP